MRKAEGPVLHEASIISKDMGASAVEAALGHEVEATRRVFQYSLDDMETVFGTGIALCKTMMGSRYIYLSED